MRKIKALLKPLFPQVFLETKAPWFSLRWLLSRGTGRYILMQKARYRDLASGSNYRPENINEFVVGSYEKQNAWSDYDDYLMKYVDKESRSHVALDFATGPGRNIIKYHDRFKRIDGADISPQNIDNARKNLAYNGIPEPRLFVTRGDNVGASESGYYDFIFSTIAMQHICVHQVRFSILAATFRALKPNGRISIQMGFGAGSPQSVDYYENNFDALQTNRGCDTRIEHASQIQGDLKSIGFENFEHWIRPTGPGDCHPNWIFFTAIKPGLNTS